MVVFFRSGQVGLMLLVVMAVVVSLVLSVASRSLHDVVLTRQEKENSAAFAVAESGVEKALLNLGNNTTAGGALSDSSGLVSGNFGIVAQSSFDLYVKEGEIAQIDLSGSPSNIVVKWVKENIEEPGTCAEGSGLAPAAIEVIKVSSTNTVSRGYYNSYGCDLSASNYFAQGSSVSGQFLSQQSITVAGGDKFLRIKPIYNGATINVTGNNLASQLYLIRSTAESGDAQKDIQVKRALSAGGSIFDYTLFSASTIIK